MTEKERDRIECAIRHIQTAVDVDPWAAEIAVAAMQKLFGNSEQLDDTISRRGTVKAIRDAMLAWSSMPQWREDKIVDAVKALPSAQPERKKGHWIEVNDNYNRISGRCSVCGWESHMYEDDVVGMDFCPNCGARLDGEQNDT